MRTFAWTSSAVFGAGGRHQTKFVREGVTSQPFSRSAAEKRSRVAARRRALACIHSGSESAASASACARASTL